MTEQDIMASLHPSPPSLPQQTNAGSEISKTTLMRTTANTDINNIQTLADSNGTDGSISAVSLPLLSTKSPCTTQTRVTITPPIPSFIKFKYATSSQPSRVNVLSVKTRAEVEAEQATKGISEKTNNYDGSANKGNSERAVRPTQHNSSSSTQGRACTVLAIKTREQTAARDGSRSPSPKPARNIRANKKMCKALEHATFFRQFADPGTFHSCPLQRPKILAAPVNAKVAIETDYSRIAWEYPKGEPEETYRNLSYIVDIRTKEHSAPWQRVYEGSDANCTVPTSPTQERICFRVAAKSQGLQSAYYDFCGDRLRKEQLFVQPVPMQATEPVENNEGSTFSFGSQVIEEEDFEENEDYENELYG